jgi:hypothetical protein
VKEKGNKYQIGGMAEWLKAAVLKTANRKVRGFESYSLRQFLLLFQYVNSSSLVLELSVKVSLTGNALNTVAGINLIMAKTIPSYIFFNLALPDGFKE